MAEAEGLTGSICEVMVGDNENGAIVFKILDVWKYPVGIVGISAGFDTNGKWVVNESVRLDMSVIIAENEENLFDVTVDNRVRLVVVVLGRRVVVVVVVVRRGHCGSKYSLVSLRIFAIHCKYCPRRV